MNRLQPDSIIPNDVCQKCDYNVPGIGCDRKMKWFWRAEFYPAKRIEYETIKKQLSVESFPPKVPGGNLRSYHQLPSEEQSSILNNRLEEFCQKKYQSKKEIEVREKQAFVCQRTNTFFINVINSFHELLHKHDNLYLAYQNIFNSFYNYIACKSSRWYSIDMAGIICNTGSNIIKLARKLIEKIGLPLKIENDGIWCIFPSDFPENYTFNLSSGKSISISYPLTVMNYLVHLHFTNDQYYDFSTNKQRKENKIFFNIDGPHRAIVLPSPSYENVHTSEQHVVFDNDGLIQGPKGFDRYGRFKLIKNFQKDIFKAFLKGKTLEACYSEVGRIADTYLDTIEHKGSSITEKEVIEYFSEERSMSYSSEDSEHKLMTTVAAKRLAELIGDQVKANKLTCHYIVSAKPLGSVISERVIPVAVFFSEENVKKECLRRWIEIHSENDFNVHNVLDWEYYKECLAKAIQNLIIIPALMQDVQNPCLRIQTSEWLCKKSDIEQMQQKSKISSISILDNNVNEKNESEYAAKRRKLNDEEEQEHLVIASRRGRNISIRKFDQGNLEVLFINKESIWEVIKIAEIDIPGSFIMWVLAGGEIQTIHLNVPRRFYINYKLDDLPTKITDIIESNGSVIKVSRNLPKSHKQFNLFEVVMPESIYQRNSVILQDIFNDPWTEGVYETQINLLSRALIEVEFVINKFSMEPDVLKDSITNGLDIKNIKDIGKSESLPSSLYLMREPGERPVNFLYLYHAESEDNNHLYGLFSSRDNKVHVFYVGLKAVVTKYSEERYAFTYKELIESINGVETSTDIFKIQNEIEVKITYLIRNIKEFATELSNEIKRHEHERHGPTVLVLESSYNQCELIEQGIDILKEFPTINIKSCYRFTTFSSAAEPMFARYIHVGIIIDHLIKKSRDARLPLCNTPIDNETYILNILNARRSIKNNDILMENIMI